MGKILKLKNYEDLFFKNKIVEQGENASDELIAKFLLCKGREAYSFRNPKDDLANMKNLVYGACCLGLISEKERDSVFKHLRDINSKGKERVSI